MNITASELTKWAKKSLEYMGCRLNRVNNIPYGKRKGTIQKGWPDLQGYTKTGQYLGVEVKTVGDRLSPEQIDRLEDIFLCGGIAYICTDKDNQPVLIEWSKMKSLLSTGTLKK
jgi:hypothetical protein